MEYIDKFLFEHVNKGRYLTKLAVIDRRILKIYINIGGEYLVFVFGKYYSDEQHYFAILQAEGDCCSSSWIEQISGLTLYPSEVRFNYMESIEMKKEWAYTQVEGDGFDDLTQYCYKIHTGYEPILIELRNNSNGYYGGELKWVEGDCQEKFVAKYSHDKLCRIFPSTSDHYPSKTCPPVFDISLSQLVE